jgi:hypothetical protein
MRLATIDEDPPGWMVYIENSRLLLRRAAPAGVRLRSQAIIDEVVKLRDAATDLPGRRVHHHYLDDHTEKIKALLKTFPARCSSRHGGRRRASTPAYDCPLTTESITDCTVVPDATRDVARVSVNFYDYPGQTLYHSALLVEHDNGERLFFLGDSFTPSGIDDYCLLNRNLMHEGEGYLRCLDILATLPDNCMLVNEHVSPVFQFDAPQLALMRKTLAERKASWQSCSLGRRQLRHRRAVGSDYPYGQPADRATWSEVRIRNHSDRAHEYTVTPHAPDGVRVEPPSARLRVEPRTEGVIAVRIGVPASAIPSACVITADVAFDGWNLRHWCEALIEIGP